MTELSGFENLLHVSKLTFSVESFEILRGLSFDLVAGEVVGLVGPNGAGKTTLMRVLAGLYEPTTGAVEVRGAAHGTSDARRNVSLMAEEPELYPGLSVLEHVRFLDRIHAGTDRRGSAEASLEASGLAAKSRSLPHELSQGMRRKLSLILALRKGARVFLFDEPFNGLDPLAVRSLRDQISLLRDAGHAVLLSMHGLRELQELADRVLFLFSGRIRAVATVPDTLSLGGRTLEDLYLEIARDTGVAD